jgi:hypothetical protein
MGWNGSSTYGVRVDSARKADDANTLDGYDSTTFLDSNYRQHWGLFSTNAGQDFLGRGKRCIVATTTNMILNYGNDFTQVDVQSSLTATGNITASGDVITNSDERLKSNIRPIDNALELVSQLEGKMYTKDNRDNQIGLIAQQVERVLPQLVHSGPDEMAIKSVNYQNIVALLIEAIKEQQVQITQLQEQLRGV